MRKWIAFIALSFTLLVSCQTTGSKVVTIPYPDSLEQDHLIQRIERSLDDPSTRVNWRNRQAGDIPWTYIRTEGNTIYASSTDGRSTYHATVTVEVDCLAIDGSRCPKQYREKFIQRLQIDLDSYHLEVTDEKGADPNTP